MNSSIKVFNGAIPGLCILLWLTSAVADAGVLNDRRSPAPDTPAATPYQGIATLELDQMADMRGGFSVGGLDLNFGATLSTVIDNVQLSTVFNITSEGAEVVSQALRDLSSVNEVIAALSQQGNSRQSSGANIVNGPAAGVTLASGTPSASQPSVPVTQPAAAPTRNGISSTQAPATTTASTTTGAQPAASPSPVPVTQPTPSPAKPAAAPSNATLVSSGNGATLADLAPVGVKLDGVDTSSGFSGLAVSNSKGFTAAVHKLTQNAAISAVISNASNQRISQKLDLSINIENVKSIREAALRSRLSRIADGVR